MHRGYHIVHRGYHKPYHGSLHMHQGGWPQANHQVQQIIYPAQPQVSHPMPYFQNQVQHSANPQYAEIVHHEIQR